MLSHKMDFNCCANRDGFRIDSHICINSDHVVFVSLTFVHIMLNLASYVRS